MLRTSDSSRSADLGTNCIGASAHAVAQHTQLLCGDSPVSEALLSVRLKPATVTKAETVLLRLGFETLFDMRLLTGKVLQEELATELKSSGLSIGDRAKVLLLVRSNADAPLQQHALRMNDESKPESESRRNIGRQLQPTDDSGLSTDTLAI
eukprot:SAG31_NODE_16302_length_714_cov_1.320325_1_plen_151_part_01